VPGPIYLVRSVRRRLRRGRRYAEIIRILVRHGLTAYLWGSRRAGLATPDGRSRLARALRQALDEGGVTFVKLGQVLATRSDLLPAEFVDELGQLHDGASQLPWTEIEPIIQKELAADIGVVFASIDEAPLAAASIAQVHAATLQSGERVVVKVRRPGVRAVVERDLDIVDRLAEQLHRRTGWGRAIGTVQLAHGFAEALREELDLRIEARNLTAVSTAAAARRDAEVKVPAVHPQLCTAAVLVMGRLDGHPLTAATAGGNPRAAGVLFAWLLRQMLLDGVFHADPHPGNVLLLADGRPAMLDFGSVGRLDAGLRAALQRLMLALDRGDPSALTDAFLEIVDRPSQLDEGRLHRSLGRVLARYIGAGLAPDVRMFGDLFRILAQHDLAVPPEIAAVFRALATLEGTLSRLDPTFDIVGEARGFACTHLAAQWQPSVVKRAATDELATLLPVLSRLPRHLDRIGGALEAGRLGVNVRLLAHPDDRWAITRLLHQLLITVLAAAAGIVAVMLLGLAGGPKLTATVTMYQFLGYCLLVVSGILALRVLVMVFRPPTGTRQRRGEWHNTADRA
jgi:ubiquinone biosynthesis protein